MEALPILQECEQVDNEEGNIATPKLNHNQKKQVALSTTKQPKKKKPAAISNTEGKHIDVEEECFVTQKANNNQNKQVALSTTKQPKRKKPVALSTINQPNKGVQPHNQHYE